MDTPQRRDVKGSELVLGLLGVVCLLVVVAIASRSGLHGGRSGPRVSERYLDYAFSSFLVLYVAAIPITAYAYLVHRRDALVSGGARQKRRLGTVAICAAFALVLAVVVQDPHLLAVVIDRLVHVRSLIGGSHSGRRAPSAGHLSARRSGPRFEWPAAAVLGPLVVLGFVGQLLLARGRPRPASAAPDDARLREELAAAIAGAIEDLHRQPDARRVVIAAYARMEAVLRRHGLPRDASETQTEFLHRVLPQLSGHGDAVASLTGLFELARFSTHAVDDEMKRSAIRSLLAVRSALAPAEAGPATAPTGEPSTRNELRVAAVKTRLLAVAPVRVALAVGFLGVSLVAGSPPGPALLAFAVGAVGFTIAVAADPRRRIPRRRPAPLPGGAVEVSIRRAAVSAVFPSTIGLAVLATIAAVRQPVLTALLGGGLLGLAAAALVAVATATSEERRLGGRLYVERATSRLYLGEEARARRRPAGRGPEELLGEAELNPQ